MSELPINIQKSIGNYKEVKVDGLTLWPVRVKEYEEFLMARPALEVMHQSLPVALMRIPLLSAYYRMDYEARENGKPLTGLFSRALLGLALSLRLGEGLDMAERLGLFRVAVERNDPATLVSLQFTGTDGETKSIEPSAYRNLREIMAAQNGVRIEDETANPDIVQARKNMAAGGAKLDYSIDALKTFTAAMGRLEESEIDEWPILKLTRTTDAYQTMLAYLVCGIGEASGATWKNGNPYPHPIFKRVDDGRGIAAPMESASNGSASAQAKAGVRVIEAQIQNH